MTGEPNSKLVTAQENLKSARNALEDALAAYQEEQKNPSGPRGRARGLEPIAKEYGVPYETLRRFSHTHSTRLDRSRRERKLYEEEEEQVVRWIEGLSDRYRGPSNSKVLDMALKIYRARVPTAQPFGHNWIDRFKARHTERIKTFWGTSFDSQRAAGLNSTAVQSYFETVSEIYEQEDVPDYCRWGCDETGFWANIGAAVRVLGRRDARRQPLQQSGDRENTTVMAAICADGSSLPPFVIFKGEQLQTAWGLDNPGSAR